MSCLQGEDVRLSILPEEWSGFSFSMYSQHTNHTKKTGRVVYKTEGGNLRVRVCCLFAVCSTQKEQTITINNQQSRIKLEPKNKTDCIPEVGKMQRVGSRHFFLRLVFSVSCCFGWLFLVILSPPGRKIKQNIHVIAILTCKS